MAPSPQYIEYCTLGKFSHFIFNLRTCENENNIFLMIFRFLRRGKDFLMGSSLYFPHSNTLWTFRNFYFRRLRCAPINFATLWSPIFLCLYFNNIFNSFRTFGGVSLRNKKKYFQNIPGILLAFKGTHVIPMSSSYQNRDFLRCVCVLLMAI